MTNEEMAGISERRRAKRFPAPPGTTALIKNSDGSLDSIRVRDISAVGLLVCECDFCERYPVNTLLDGILLDIPPDESGANGRMFLLINNGRVVRSFLDQDTITRCYGIELTSESSYVRHKLQSLADKAELSS